MIIKYFTANFCFYFYFFFLVLIIYSLFLTWVLSLICILFWFCFVFFRLQTFLQIVTFLIFKTTKMHSVTFFSCDKTVRKNFFELYFKDPAKRSNRQFSINTWTVICDPANRMYGNIVAWIQCFLFTSLLQVKKVELRFRDT